MILIRSKDKRNDKFLLELAKRLRLQARVLKEDDEQDLRLIKFIDEGMSSGEGSSTEVKKMFSRHGVKI